MKINTTLKFVDSALKVSRTKGNTYTVGLFVQGVEPINLMLPNDIPKLIPNKEYSVSLDYNFKYNNMRITSIK